MHVLIIGSTGGTGRRLVLQAIERGYHVTAFARNPDAVVIRHDALTIVQGDVMDPASLERAVPGCDAVLSALGSRSLKRSPVIAQGTRNLIAAMETAGVRRLVCETSLGVGDSKGQLGFFYDAIIVPLVLREALLDKEEQEAIIRASSLDWVIVRPSGLTDDPRTGRYSAWTGQRQQRITGRIARADVADCMLDQVTDDRWLRQAVNISS